jgi:PAS domain S-box-containing protein
MVRVEDMPSLAESILEQMGDVVIYADETGTIRWWNSAATILFGYSAAEAVGQTPGLIPLHLRDADWRGFHAAITTGVMKLKGDADMRDAPIRTKPYIEMTFALVKGPDASTALGAVAVARAVTGRIDRQRGTDREPH